MTNSGKLQGTHKWHVGHRSPDAPELGIFPLLCSWSQALWMPHISMVEGTELFLPPACLLLFMASHSARFWCRFSNCRHRAAHLLGDFQEGLSRGPWTSWACIIQTASHPFRTQSSLASVLMFENMGAKGKVRRRENIKLLCWTLGYVSGVWGTVI